MVSNILDKFYNFVEKVGKPNFILMVFVLVVFIVTGLYQTFSLYTTIDGTSVVDGLTTYKFILANGTENSVTIAANSSKNLDVTVSNEDSIALNYGIYYSSTSDLTDVNVGYLSSSDYPGTGLIAANSDYVVTMKIDNNTDFEVTIQLGVAYGLPNGGELIKEDTQYWVEEINYTYLNTVEVGSYVSYTGSNGCSGNACSGENANYVDATDMGYCYSDYYKFTVSGWRVAYIQDNTAYLVSAGAPECVNTLVETVVDREYEEVKGGEVGLTVDDSYYYSDAYYVSDDGKFVLESSYYGVDIDVSKIEVSEDTPLYTCNGAVASCTTMYAIYEVSNEMTKDVMGFMYTLTGGPTVTTGPEQEVGTPTHLANLEAQALKYCNATLAYNGLCNSDSAWAFDNIDFQNITGSVLSTDSCYGELSTACGLGNTLIDNGGYYWYATTFNSIGNDMAMGVLWYPVNGITDGYYYLGATNKQHGLRPVIRLKESVIIIGGSGTDTDPYQIAA